MVEFSREFENRRIEIARVNSIIIAKYIDFRLFTSFFGGVCASCDQCRFSMLSQGRSVHL